MEPKQLFIIGENGSGKSSFMQYVCFSLISAKRDIDMKFVNSRALINQYQAFYEVASLELEKILVPYPYSNLLVDKPKPAKYPPFSLEIEILISTKSPNISVDHKTIIPNYQESKPILWRNKLNEVTSPYMNKYQRALEEFLSFILSCLTFLKKLILRLQYISNQIQDRIARSPTSQKKEPPVGGVKIGGEQHGRTSHVARRLYRQKNFILATCYCRP